MVKRLKVWSYLALAAGASLYHVGCISTDWLPPYVWGILREDIFG